MVVGVLKHHARVTANEEDVFGIACLFAKHAYRTAVGQEQGVNVFGKRRLAAAVAAQDAHKRAGLYMQVHPVERILLPVVSKSHVLEINHISRSFVSKPAITQRLYTPG